ncbi:carbohydrate-binding module family 43 protein [Peniophora sp. CONT]|nr:carbohydrate-binding module family 43 protein [Peniophora sp. CONT]
MQPHSRLWTSLAAVATLAAQVQGLGKVSRTGKYLFNEDGSRFFIKGVAYQPQGAFTLLVDSNSGFIEPTSFTDPLADSDSCARDLPFLKDLGVNVVHVYSVNSSLNHDSCMQALSGAGIYTIIDLTLPVNGSINRAAPQWTTSLLDQYLTTVDAFEKYDNVLAYGVGNEVIIGADGTGVAPYIKAGARDVRAYLNSIKSSALVAYSAVDGDTWIYDLAQYLNCDPASGNDASTSIDLYGLNNYELCGNQTFDDAYKGKTDQFAQRLDVAAYFSEYGCVRVSPRPWADVAALFSDEGTAVWSGGVAFSYFPAVSTDGQFGMVNVSGSTVTTGQDFENLKAAYANAKPTNSPTQSAAPSPSYASCPSSSGTWLASNSLPPTPNDAACSCLDSVVSCLFTPKVDNTSAIVGELFNTACQLLGGQGSNCNAITGNGTTGTYGAVSGCDSDTMLSFVMTQWYELSGRNPEACSFAGNGTLNQQASTTASGVDSAASSCLASASGVSTPAAPTAVKSSGTGSSSGSQASSSTGSGSSNASGAVSFGEASLGAAGVALMVLISVVGGAITLA